jgi:hypothetical protein
VVSDLLGFGPSVSEGSGLLSDGLGGLLNGVSVGGECGGSGSGGSSLISISGSLNFLGFLMSLNGSFFTSLGLGLGSESTFMVSHSGIILRFGSGFFSFSVSKGKFSSSVLGNGAIMSSRGSFVGFGGFGGGNLGGVVGSEGMESESISGVSGFRGLEGGEDGESLPASGSDGGCLGTFVGIDGVFVFFYGSVPFGVPFTLNSDLLSSGVLGVEVNVGRCDSSSVKLHVFSDVLGTGSLSFGIGVERFEERIVSVGGTSGGFGTEFGACFHGSLKVESVVSLIVAWVGAGFQAPPSSFTGTIGVVIPGEGLARRMSRASGFHVFFGGSLGLTTTSNVGVETWVVLDFGVLVANGGSWGGISLTNSVLRSVTSDVVPLVISLVVNTFLSANTGRIILNPVEECCV